MASTYTSALRISDSITSEQISEADFIPNSGNIYPKFPEKLRDTAVEVWLFDAIAADGSSTITISFLRDIVAAPKGFRIGFNASWPDGSIWGSPLIFAESIITSEGSEIGNGKVLGVWKTQEDGSQASFEIAADLSSVKLIFNVPGKVNGTLTLKSLGFPCLPATEREAKGAPDLYWMRPIAMAEAEVDMTFHFEPAAGEVVSKPPQRMLFGREQGAFGGVDRSWESMPWTKAVTDSVFLRAKVGPYVVQVLRLVGRPEHGCPLSATARLYQDGKLICAPVHVFGQKTSDEEKDSVEVDKLFDGDGVAAKYKHKNVGYKITFRSGGSQSRQWVFEARHSRAWYAKPTSAPGPDGTGSSGFVASVRGGPKEQGKSVQGWGYLGQVEMPV